MEHSSFTSAAVLEDGPDALSRLQDRHGRLITDLRVSITDRCNYRCVYCRTGNVGAQYAELPIAAYVRMVRAFVDLGIEKVRLTGGEPLLRRGLTDLISELASMRTINRSPLDLAITTNGHLLEDQAWRLRDAGLNRITVSMDAVDAETAARITRVPGSFDHVLKGIQAAQRAGLEPVKVNCVLLRGFNDDQIVPFARFSRERGVVVRFIEFMPLDEDRSWTLDSVVSYSEVKTRLESLRPLVKLDPTTSGETAVRYTFDDGIGEIGIIAPVSRAFCGECSRIRVTSDGKIRTCLFSQSEHDLYAILQRGGTDNDLASFIRRTVIMKEARHHIGEPGFLKPSRSMVHIGG
ncbi:GTP 3',8-cyclase MoaA [Edaphobacter sp. HDX4]|uniref:GTP 3',8-cyclase MoaA n=1 Tax=Edaphobacter sp. HDX4 TaxID=2794064 RepID=UPI002FE6C0C3